jgi:hypothetical protein
MILMLLTPSNPTKYHVPMRTFIEFDAVVIEIDFKKVIEFLKENTE